MPLNNHIHEKREVRLNLRALTMFQCCFTLSFAIFV